MHTHRFHIIFEPASAALAGLFLLCVLAVPSTAAAWDFDGACAEETGFETVTGGTPQAMFMVDRSGSMNGGKWTSAKNVIDTVTYDLTQPNPDDLQFGIGLFYSSTATINLEAKENANPDIMNVLNSTSPGGGTPMARAIRTTKNSSTISNASDGAAGVLVTDGVPSSSRTDTIKAACEHRQVAPLYTVGFGTGTDKDFNDVLAAAGGTGSCTGGSPCDAGANQYDPGFWTNLCTGSYQADNETQLQNDLNNIADQISCTFDISTLTTNKNNPVWDDPDQGCDSGFDCLYLKLNGSVNGRVYHMNASSGPNGWTWASSAHTHVRLLDTGDGADANYCTKWRNGQLEDANGDDIEVTRACMCERNTGASCQADNMQPPPRTCECQVGTWTCNQGIDVCQPRDPCQNDNGNAVFRRGEGGACSVGEGVCQRDGVERCPSTGAQPECDATAGEPEEQPETTCDARDNDCDGLVDNVQWDNTEMCHVDEGRDAAAIDAETVRCKVGFAGCEDGEEICEPLEPMPEVCNGIDDDCVDGVDNLRDSWRNVLDDNNNPYTLPGEYDSATCHERNVCSCRDGTDDIEGTNFDDYVEGWANGSSPPRPTCVCGEGLSR